jgi:hypothetical protein
VKHISLIQELIALAAFTSVISVLHLLQVELGAIPGMYVRCV